MERKAGTIVTSIPTPIYTIILILPAKTFLIMSLHWILHVFLILLLPRDICINMFLHLFRIPFIPVRLLLLLFLLLLHLNHYEYIVAAFLSFSSNITLAGVTTSTLATSAQLAVMNATATSMGLPMSDVLYSGSSGASPTTTTAMVTHQEVRLRRVQAEKPAILSPEAVTSYTLVAETTTTISLPPSQDASTAYTQYTTALTQAVDGTAYSQSLQTASKAYGAVATSSASATGVTSSAATVETVSSSDSGSSSSNDGLSDGAIAGVVIGVVVGLGLLVALGYYLFTFVFVAKSPALASQQ